MRSQPGHPGHGTRLAAPALVVAAVALLLGAVAPGAAGPGQGPASFVEAPDPSCPGATFVPGASLDQDCGDGGKVISTGGGAGPGGILDAAPLVVVAAGAAGLLLLAAAILFLRTRRAEVAAPSDEWWTCPRCGAGNVVGAARCHRCGTWRTAEPHSSPSATR